MRKRSGAGDRRPTSLVALAAVALLDLDERKVGVELDGDVGAVRLGHVRVVGRARRRLGASWERQVVTTSFPAEPPTSIASWASTIWSNR
jgi:hypothetical protein